MRNKILFGNPFKIWGSYIGGIIGFIFGIWLSSIRLGQSLNVNLDIEEVPTILFGTSLGIILVIPSIIIGFLIGWGIHSAVTAIRK